MARNLALQDGVDPADSDYPSGRARDDDGTGTYGTPANEAILGDMLQFFMKLIRMAAITTNNLPDSEYNGFQYVEALIGALRASQAEINDISTTDIDTFVSPGRLAAATTVVGSFNAAKLSFITINIGDWNMDTTAGLSIAYPAGVTKTAIRQIQVLIIDDAGLITNDLTVNSKASASDFSQQEGRWYLTNTTIELERRTTGFFDSPDYDTPGYNRGYITLLLSL